MVNKKSKYLFCGFTLIEMIGIIILLGLIGLIVYPTILKIINESKEDLYQKNISELERLATSWASVNDDKLPTVDKRGYYLKIEELQKDGFIDGDIKNSKTGEDLDGCIGIIYDKSKDKYTYQYYEDCTNFQKPTLSSLSFSTLENEYGWRNQDFYVTLESEYLDSYEYCIDDNKCEPNTTMNANESILVNQEGIKYVCAKGSNTVGDTTTECALYRLDKTKPDVGTIVFSGTKGLNDWYISNVTVSTTKSSDDLSGIVSEELSPSVTLITNDTGGTTYTLTAKDLAGNVSEVSYSVKIDKTKPSVGELVVNGTKGLNDWYISNVTFSVNDGSDLLSGHNTTTSSISSITTDTKGTKVVVTSMDNAGNTATKDYIVKVDKTAPTAGTATFAGNLGEDNWYNSDVSVSVIDGSDATSGHNNTTSNVSIVTTETSGTKVVITTMDNAGNTSTRDYTIKIDKTPPTAGTATFAGTLGSNNWYTSNVTVNVTNGSDDLSGHSTTTSDITSITSNTSGKTITVTTKDKAGNTSSRTYSIKVDKTTPTITAKSSSNEVFEGDSVSTLTYFNNPTYSISGGGTVSCNESNTSTLNSDVYEYTISCTATGNNGLKKTASTTLIVEALPNPPVLYNNMVPIKYSNNKWVVANDGNEEWYNYFNKEWANAVVLNSGTTKTVGQEVTEEDVALWYVWIPRYRYTIFNGNNGTASEQLIKISYEKGTRSKGTVTCVDNANGSETCTDSKYGSVTNGKSTYNHPAFKFGTTELTGFWFGKFEVSGSTSAIKMIPNKSSLRSVSVYKFFTAIQKLSTTYSISNADSHMIKNMEWGAAAYLKQSRYGQGTTEITINNNSSYYTGGGTSDAYKTNVLQSTTGNVYGIYDMNGGAWETVMGNMLNSSNAFYSSSGGFSSAPASKYYNTYKYDSSSTTTSSRGKLGDATKETITTLGTEKGGWYSDYTSFPYSSNSWFARGGRQGNGVNAGEFAYDWASGGGGYRNSTRAALTAK